MATFVRSVALPHSPHDVYAWHARDGAFERLVPPWQRVEVVKRVGDFANLRAEMRIQLGPLSLPWVAQHSGAVSGQQFIDTQLRGPFARWQHTHRFEATATGSQLVDAVDFAVPGGWLGQRVAGRAVDAMLARTFAFRHRRTRLDLAAHARWAHCPRMRIALTGGTGVVGSALTAYLQTAGHTVLQLVRRPARNQLEVQWDPLGGSVNLAALEGIDAAVHLAGENVGARWTPERKIAVMQSRVRGTATLVNALLALQKRPTVLVSASAVGIYGDTGGAVVDEGAAAGTGFLADVCRAWERAAEPARQAGIRVVHPRIGVVLTAKGGALVKMLPVFRAGLGGRIGSGRQGLPWIALDDVLGALELALHDAALEGAVNLVAPGAGRQMEFARTLARVLGRPGVLPMPDAVVRALFGDMGREVLLAGQFVRAGQLVDRGFCFQFEELGDLLRFELGLAG